MTKETTFTLKNLKPSPSIIIPSCKIHYHNNHKISISDASLTSSSLRIAIETKPLDKLLSGNRSFSYTPSFARNPFSDCEIFTTGGNNNQKDGENRLRRKSSWDIVELLALDNFRNWMICFCVVNFDLELGQAIDSMYPPLGLGEEEKKNICFSAFPDSNSFDLGDTVFNFRTRCSKSIGPTADAGFLYGYAFFRQKKDSSIRRVSILGPSYFEVGKPMLEAACHDIASWKSPSPGKYFELPFLRHVIQVEIPQSNKPQLLETCPFDMLNYRPDLQILASLPPTPMFSHFKDIIKDLWLCWELMLLGDPIVLIAPDPKICSEAVLELMDIINPIPYCGDYRPYFTIQDPDFKSFVTKNRPPSNIIIGVTNPFFTKALQHWPNIIRGVTSKRKSVIAKDKAILKQLASAMARGYPSESPQLKPFKTDNFLRSLQEHGNNITNTYVNFYTQFLKCGNFATWLRQRTIEAQNELRKRYLQVLCEGDVQKWIIGKHEMELVDLLVRIRDELVCF
ncbi:2340_t:CDS:10 [Diversispora eburnea]|uniref:2340_t:CDS:1 n=1 Tax=Diversispora eburnea TaxID=1213867 RepID=A0A9N8V9I6_9GLOM|nr:2340_t:CDS:10 [Diversispora eburnea]